MKLQVDADLSATLPKASVTAPRAAHCYCRPIVWWRHCAGQYMQVKHSSADLLSLHRLSQLIFILLLPPPKLQQLLVCLLQVGKEIGVLLGQGIDLRLVLSNVRAELSVLGHHWVICRRQWRDSSAKQGPHSRVQARAGSSTACLTTGRSAAHSGAKGLSAWSCKLDPQSHYISVACTSPFADMLVQLLPGKHLHHVVCCRHSALLPAHLWQRSPETACNTSTVLTVLQQQGLRRSITSTCAAVHLRHCWSSPLQPLHMPQQPQSPQAPLPHPACPCLARQHHCRRRYRLPPWGLLLLEAPGCHPRRLHSAARPLSAAQAT